MDPGFRLDDRYRLEQRRTPRPHPHGSAQVWTARDELLARRVAVTVVGVPAAEEDVRRRLRDAARAAAALAHPGLVTTYDYGEADGPGGEALTYVVTEHLDGESLAARLERGVPDAQDAVGLCAQLADALMAVHARGLVHGDLRAGQVLLTDDGVKLLGLGAIGALADPDAVDGPAEATGDVLAFGRILAACLTGDPEAAPGGGVPAGAPGDLVELAARCRAAEAAERPAFTDVARALAPHVTDTAPLPAVDVPQPVPAPGRSRWRRLRRTPRATVLGGAAAAVLALALAPLGVIVSSLSDAPRGVALPPLPTRSSTLPSRSAPPPDVRPRTPSGPGSAAASATTTRAGAAVPAARTRAVTVRALARMRRVIDVGIAAGEVGPRFGVDLAREVTTLLNEVDGGEPVDLVRRVGRLRAAIDGRRPGEVSPGRVADLTALLAEVPLRSRM